MAKKGGLGLGRGLDALLPDVEQSAAIPSYIKTPDALAAPPVSSSLPEGISADSDGNLWADPALLMPNPQQPRTEFDATALQELADSIRENGVLQPIIIEPVDGGGFYIIAGERRTRAAKLAGVTSVPVQLRRYDDQKKLEVALIENIQREDLNPIEEARAYAHLMQMGNLNQEDIAKRIGKNRSTVANALRLLKLPEDMQKALISGQLTAGHARALLAVTSDADQRVLFGKIIGGGLSVREAEALATEYNNGGRAAVKKSPPKTSPARDPDVAAIEQQFIEVLGTKCTIKGSLERGTIAIDFFSRADLERLYGILIAE
ncbi:MAG: ParB/RepB/Spo0J family partition protein [Treponema sp.]|nr:ParB/RepB/Spo0J family partition protein [Treponema sp.]